MTKKASVCPHSEQRTRVLGRVAVSSSITVVILSFESVFMTSAFFPSSFSEPHLSQTYLPPRGNIIEPHDGQNIFSASMAQASNGGIKVVRPSLIRTR